MQRHNCGSVGGVAELAGRVIEAAKKKEGITVEDHAVTFQHFLGV